MIVQLPCNTAPIRRTMLPCVAFVVLTTVNVVSEPRLSQTKPVSLSLE
jgi:hypothetical protein